jgi:hypothetical protein
LQILDRRRSASSDFGAGYQTGYRRALARGPVRAARDGRERKAGLRCSACTGSRNAACGPERGPAW